MSYHRPTREAAKSKWRGILMTLGVPGAALTGRHGPCPLCGGTDRFRWDNKEGSGSYICGQCGAGDGMQFAERFIGRPFAEVAAQIDGILGNEKIGADRPKAEMSDDAIRTALRGLYAATVPIQKGDLADRYLASRNLDDPTYPSALRFGAAVKDGEGGVRPCMVAIVSDLDGKPATMHRTFLRPDGMGKAEMSSPRKIMPGPIPDGAAIRLSEYTGGPLGIAEGIETALAASARFDIPVWAVISSGMMEKWTLPDGCEEVAIFGDNDAKFGGQAAAYRLAHRLAVRGIEVNVCIAPGVDKDWADYAREDAA